jgi:uncharacterized protein (DUF302 family)
METSVLFILIGMVLMGFGVWFMMPKLMFTMYKSESDFEKTMNKLKDEINATGEWKVTKESDFQKNIQDAGHGKIEKVGSIAVCNPKYASLILTEEPNRKVTSIMPLSIGIYENKSKQVYVSGLNIRLLGMMFGGTIAKVMNMAGNDVKNIIASATKK